MQYDAGGDEHYDVASALIKSIRGSDVDAGIYWLVRVCWKVGKTYALFAVDWLSLPVKTLEMPTHMPSL